VYSESEYLNGAGLELTDAGDWPAVEPAVGLAEGEFPVAVEPGLPADESMVAQEPAVDLEPGDAPIEEHIYGGDAPLEERAYGGFAHGGRRGVRLRRIAGVAMLAGAVGTVGGVVALNISRAHQGVGRRPGSLVAQSSREMSSPELAGSRPAPSAPAVVPQAKAPSSSVAHAGRRDLTNFRTRRHGGSNSRTPGARRGSVSAQSSVGVGVRRGGGVAIALDYSPSASVDESTVGSTAASSSLDTSRPPDVSRPPAASAAVEQVEFGFER
jgi:hypothetical protein